MVVDFARQIGFLPLRLDYSPIKGPEGNIEYLLHMRKISNEPIEQADDITMEVMKECVEQSHQTL